MYLHCFAFLSVYVSHMCLVPAEGRRKGIPWGWAYRAVSYHVGTGDQSQVVHKSNKYSWLLSQPQPLERVYFPWVKSEEAGVYTIVYDETIRSSRGTAAFLAICSCDWSKVHSLLQRWV